MTVCTSAVPGFVSLRRRRNVPRGREGGGALGYAPLNLVRLDGGAAIRHRRRPRHRERVAGDNLRARSVGADGAGRRRASNKASVGAEGTRRSPRARVHRTVKRETMILETAIFTIKEVP